jgi:branched-chain amino acid aminotransferase
MSGSLVWLDGSLVRADAARVSAFDHGYTVGDGVFETCKALRGRPFALTRHLRRLDASARALGLPTPAPGLVREAAAAVLDQLADAPLARLRITWTGGAGPLGSARGAAPPTLFVAAAVLAPPPASESVAVVPWRRNEHGATTGVKTTSYAENVVALAYAKAAGAGEALFANTAGDLCEGTGSNVFVVRAGRVSTPPLSSGCLAGVTRALVLEWCPEVVEEPLGPSVLETAEEVFLTSSTRDVLPVHSVGGRRVAPGPVTARIAAEFARRAAVDSDPI